MKIIGECSLPYLNPRAFHGIFSHPWLDEEGCDETALVGARHPARINPSHNVGNKICNENIERATKLYERNPISD